MKKILFIIIGLFLCSCEFVNEDVEVGELYFYDFENDIQVESIKDAVEYVSFEIVYKLDIGDYWQTPEETIKLKTGDCEDKAILLMFLLKNKLNYNPFLLISFNKISGNCHATVFSNNLFMDATNGTIEKQLDDRWIAIDILSYDETIWQSINHH